MARPTRRERNRPSLTPPTAPVVGEQPTESEQAVSVEPTEPKTAKLVCDVYVDSKRYWDVKEINAALKQGIESGSPFILLTLPNAGRALTQKEVDAMVATMQSNPKCAALSASLSGSQAFLAPKSGGASYRPVPFVPFSTCLIRADVLLSFGLLDPRFDFGWGADIDFALRLASEGWAVAVADNITVNVNDSQADYGRPEKAHFEMAHHVQQVVLNDKWPNGAAKLTAGFSDVDLRWAWAQKKSGWR